MGHSSPSDEKRHDDSPHNSDSGPSPDHHQDSDSRPESGLPSSSRQDSSDHHQGPNSDPRSGPNPPATPNSDPRSGPNPGPDASQQQHGEEHGHSHEGEDSHGHSSPPQQQQLVQKPSPQEQQGRPNDGPSPDNNARNDGHNNDNGNRDNRSNSNDEPVRQHTEHFEHQNGNPNNFERVSHDVINDNRNGVHVNKLEHVSVSGNNVVGKVTGRVVQGSNGAVSNGRNNVIAVGSDIVNYYGGFDDYDEKPMNSRSMGRGNRAQDPYGAYDPGYGHSQRPTTASTVGSSYAMGISHPAESHSKQGHKQLLPKLSIPSDNEKMSYSESSTASAGYSPPSQPLAVSAQYSATSQLSRNKTVKDRYASRKAGGDSCMGECCESCCGRLMRCACCCISPIITWALILLVLVGIALALYFNWDKITNKINNLDNTAAATPAAAAAGDVTNPATAVSPAATDLLNTVSAILTSALPA
ncbi:hypothetical protein H4R99_008009 [Coemansia sp. RSA 1722]|nr:hypothetical protein H4R99_008009 [Coemansia sp. RSA 1722]